MVAPSTPKTIPKTAAGDCSEDLLDLLILTECVLALGHIAGGVSEGALASAAIYRSRAYIRTSER